MSFPVNQSGLALDTAAGGAKQSQSVDAAERKAIQQIYQETNALYLQSLTQEVAKAEGIADPQLKRYYLPFFERSTQLVGRSLLDAQQNATTFVLEVADEYRRRLHQ